MTTVVCKAQLLLQKHSYKQLLQKHIYKHLLQKHSYKQILLLQKHLQAAFTKTQPDRYVTAK